MLSVQIQVAYQACNTNTTESCSCAVAIKSGDDVFVLDRCRLHSNYCSEGDESCRLLRAVLYLNGELTPGTRIFQTDGGLGYQVSKQPLITQVMCNIIFHNYRYW